jgi:hypothetical protein
VKKQYKFFTLKELPTEEIVTLLKNKKARIMSSEYALANGQEVDKVVRVELQKTKEG